MADSIQIKVPDIGDFAGVDVIEILVKEGDEVAAEDSLLTLESDKATMEVPSPRAGIIRKIHISVGDSVSEGDVVADLEVAESGGDASDADDDAADDDAAQSADDQSSSEQSTEPSQDDGEQADDSANDTAGQDSAPPAAALERSDKLPHASPSVRKLARELEIDLDQIKGSGRKGRITHDDLHQRIKQGMQQGGGSGAGMNVAAMPKVDFSKFGETEEQPLSRIQKLSGANLHRNWVTIPHVTQHDEADITSLEAFRKAHDAQAKEQGTRLTLLVFLIKACVAALKEFPTFNASLSSDGGSLVLKKYFHIGIAVDTPNGLVVPVIRDCDQKSLMELAHELTELSGKARDGKLSPGEMQGGCFSISSLGGIGGTAFTPIINAPEVAILGVSRSAMKPVWNGNGFDPQLMLPLSLSYDHRVIDGAAAARFTRFLASRLEDFRRVLL
ncbi:MAG: dihydrolipoyllysine-residue acetyltransferase [Wenzhouxiangellaceae bacterium]